MESKNRLSSFRSKVQQGISIVNQNFRLNGLRSVIAVFLFIAAFLIPLGILGSFGKGPITFTEVPKERVSERDLPRFVIRGPDSYIKVTTSDPARHLGPTLGRDMVIMMWLKLNVLQTDDRRAVVLLQSQLEQRQPPGFGLAFLKTAEKIRPEVYWRTERPENSGGWLSFEDLDLNISEPVIVSLSIRSGRVLGLHQIQRGAGKKNSVKLLGGAEIGQYGGLQGSKTLIIGAPDYSKFKGDILGLIIQNTTEIPEDLSSFYKTMGFWPKDVAANIPKEDLQFFVDGSGQVQGEPVQPLIYHRAAIKVPGVSSSKR